MSEAETLSPAVLVWARETAGLSIEEAAAKLGLADTRKATAVERLRDAEGSGRVGRPTLLKMASTYKRPLLNFYLQRPPPTGERGVDFRMRGTATSKREEAFLDALLRDIRVRQGILREVLEDEEAARVGFVASGSLEEDVDAGVIAIRTLLYLDAAPPVKIRDADTLFRALRERVERAGIAVLLAGDLGNYHSAINSSVFSGFASPDPIAPLIVINPNQAATARCFTLIHELAHLWLGAGGVSGRAEDDPRLTTRRLDLEGFCNAVAADVLLPDALLPEAPRPDGESNADVLAFVDRVARLHHVSPAMVLVRLGRKGWVSRDVWAEVAAVLRTRWHGKPSANREDDESGPTFYTVRRSYLGALMMGAISRAVRRDGVTYSRAARALGVKPGMVEAMLGASRR